MPIQHEKADIPSTVFIMWNSYITVWVSCIKHLPTHPLIVRMCSDPHHSGSRQCPKVRILELLGDGPGDEVTSCPPAAVQARHDGCLGDVTLQTYLEKIFVLWRVWSIYMMWCGCSTYTILWFHRMHSLDAGCNFVCSNWTHKILTCKYMGKLTFYRPWVCEKISWVLMINWHVIKDIGDT